MHHELRTTCNRDCPDSCGIIASVHDGRIVGHRGDPEHGVTRGFLCARGNRFLERFYHPQRLLHPLRRTKAGHERLAWDDALDIVAAKLSRVKAESGPEAVLYVQYSGIHHWLGRVMARLFWAYFGGPTSTSGGLSVEPLHAAQTLDFGGECCPAPEDLVRARGFVLWGKNPAVTRLHWMPFIKEARRAGAPLWVIDPLATATAKTADRFVQIRPGGDAPLAMAIARRLIEMNAVDAAFLREHCRGFEALRDRLLACTPAALVAAAGVSPADLEGLASFYAQTRPLASMVGLGVAYWKTGGAAVRLIDALSAMTGNIGVSGGSVASDLKRPTGFDLSAIEQAPKSKHRQIRLPRLGREILTAQPRLRMAFVAGANPAATAPDAETVKRGLSSLESVVVVEQFMTATAELADIVLPCTTYLEMEDLVTAYGHEWLGVTRAVVPPSGECRTDAEIFQALADRFGFGAALAGSPESWLTRLLAPLNAHGVTLASLRERPQRHPLATPVPFADRRFGTASGQVELLTELPPLATALAPGELHFVATKSLNMVSSQILPELLPEECIARVSPARLSREGFADGARVRVTSPVGTVRAILKSDPTLRDDVLLMNPALWRGDATGVNQLRVAELTDLGDGAAFHETRVRLAADV